MSIFKRNGAKHYTFKFMHDGKIYQRSTFRGERSEALAVEAAARKRVETGLSIDESQTPTPPPKLTGNDILDRLAMQYRSDGQDYPQTLSRLRRLRGEFGAYLAEEITTPVLEAYKVKRQRSGAACGTINRELAMLCHAFVVSELKPPRSAKLQEAAARKGFFNAAQMGQVLSHLPDDGLRDFAAWCYCTGMRTGEAKKLRWEYLEQDELHIPGEDCKNRKPRVLYVYGELASILARRKKARFVNGSLSSLIFHRRGQPIRDPRTAWKNACEKSGCPGRLMHDLRRSAVRDMIRGGTPQSVCMDISGHRSLSIFKRYNITDGDDQREAFRRTQLYREEQRAKVAEFSG
jgi:integrase